jgi:hypothetical protein
LSRPINVFISRIPIDVIPKEKLWEQRENEIDAEDTAKRLIKEFIELYGTKKAN